MACLPLRLRARLRRNCFARFSGVIQRSREPGFPARLRACFSLYPFLVKIFSQIVVWLAWLFVAFFMPLETYFLVKWDAEVNSFPRAGLTFTLLQLGVLVLICGAFRFWLSRMRSPGWSIIPHTLGILFSYTVAMEGIFLASEYLLLYQAAGYVLLMSFFPPLVKFRPPKIPTPRTPPSLPKTAPPTRHPFPKRPPPCARADDGIEVPGKSA